VGNAVPILIPAQGNGEVDAEDHDVIVLD
jgi:hypothetical protein